MYKKIFFLIILVMSSSCSKSVFNKNRAPDTPGAPSGPDTLGVYEDGTFSAYANDPDGDRVKLRFDWDDGMISDWSEYFSSGERISMTHNYSDIGTYYVRVQAKDENGNISDWSDAHRVIVKRWRLLIRDGNENWYRDIKEVYFRLSFNTLYFRVTFNGSFTDPHSRRYGIDTGIFLDVDRDPNTGLGPGSNFPYHPHDIGADYVAVVGYEGDKLWRWTGTSWDSSYANFDFLNFTNSSFDVGIPLNNIQNPSAIDLVVTNITMSQDSTFYWDWAPDYGHVTIRLSGGKYTISRNIVNAKAQKGESKFPSFIQIHKR